MVIIYKNVRFKISPRSKIFFSIRIKCGRRYSILFIILKNKICLKNKSNSASDEFKNIKSIQFEQVASISPMMLQRRDMSR